MKKFLQHLILSSLILSVSSLTSYAQSSLNRHEKGLKIFFSIYCVSCHGPDKQKGQVRLDTIDWDIQDNDTAQRWQDILDQIHGGDMPPEEEEQPDTTVMKKATHILSTKIKIAHKDLADNKGEIKLRKLNRREYINTVNDLLGFRLPEDFLPEDVETENFDTIGEEQFFTSHDLETYLEVGTKVAKRALEWIPRPHKEAKIERVDRSKKIVQDHLEKVARGDKQMAMKKQGKSWQEMGFKDEGEAEILFSQFDGRVNLRRRYTELPRANEGIYLTSLNSRHDARISTRVDPRGYYKVRLRGGYVGQIEEKRRRVDILIDNKKIHSTFKFTEPATNPQVIEIIMHPPYEKDLVSWMFKETYKPGGKMTRRVVASDDPLVEGENPWPSAWIDWIESEGPFYPEQPPQIEQIFFPNGRDSGEDPILITEKNATSIISQFCELAFRKQTLDSVYIKQLSQHYKHLIDKGGSNEEAMAEVFGIILTSPKFLYITEPSQQRAGTRRLNNRELAIRLSYFLWSSLPDEELYAANLMNPTVYNQQFERMINDPKAKRFSEGFMNQWAELWRYDAIAVDTGKYTSFNDSHRLSARQEPAEFFNALVQQNLPVKNLIDSSFVMLDPNLDHFYGIYSPKVKPTGFTAVKLPSSSPRGGISTQAAFLTIGSNGERSSPVIRGAILMEKLLHDKPLPPPPNVPELGSSTGKPLSNREMVIKHQSQRVCSTCHKKMDAIGFGLENFNAIGEWQDTELVGDEYEKINARSSMPGGKSFKGVEGLKAELLREKDKTAEEIVKSLMSYALGRTIQFSDQPTVDKILTKWKPKNYPVRDLVKEIVNNNLFKSK